MSEAAKNLINHPYITKKEGVCGGKPIIAGTRINTELGLQFPISD